ncbi:MAG: helix-turn-helix transcriptional regulator, partial [Sinomicrobium sp.]|nr:helix-turn-helix transcriptional regulator [Sinomicrobium sp.]
QFSIEQLARELFVDPSNLFRKIKALTGLNPTQYLRSYRLANAKKLLKTTGLSITAIALECGFSHHNYFSRIFKRETGLSPSDYRSRVRK